MAVQGLENMMKVNVIHFKRGPDTSKDKKKFNFVSDAEGDGKNSHAPPDLEISGLFRPEK